MPMNLYPDMLATHDVSGGTHLRTLPLLLDVGDSITSAAVVAVDPVTSEPIVGDTLEIWGDAACTNPVLTWGLISETAQGDLWGVNLYLRRGAANVRYTLQLRYRLASQPLVDQYDELYRVSTVV